MIFFTYTVQTKSNNSYMNSLFTLVRCLVYKHCWLNQLFIDQLIVYGGWNVRWCCIARGCTQGIPRPAFLRSPAWTECRGWPQPPGLRLPTQLAQNRPITSRKPLLFFTNTMTEADKHTIHQHIVIK